MELAILAGRLLLGSLLCVSGALKLLDLDHFRNIVQRFRVLPGGSASAYALLVPLLEISAGFFLVFGVFLAQASIVATGLFASFTAGVALALRRGVTSECGCFGRLSRGQISQVTMLRAFLLVLTFGLFGLIARWSEASPVNDSADVSTIWATLSIVITVIILTIARRLMPPLKVAYHNAKGRTSNEAQIATSPVVIGRRGLLKAMAVGLATLTLGYFSHIFATPASAACNYCDYYCGQYFETSTCPPQQQCCGCCWWPQGTVGRYYTRWYVYNTYDEQHFLCEFCDCNVVGEHWCNSCECPCAC